MHRSTRTVNEIWNSGNTNECTVVGSTSTTCVTHRSAVEGVAADTCEVLGHARCDADVAGGSAKADLAPLAKVRRLCASYLPLSNQ